MRYIFLLLIISSCTQEPPKQAIEKTPPTPKYSDSLIKAEEGKAIGNILFGISEKEFEKQKNVFQKKTTEKGDYYGSIGNFVYTGIDGDFYKGKLWRLTIEGHHVKYNVYASKMPNQIWALEEMLKQRFGDPDKFYGITMWSDMEENYNYTVSQWNVGAKQVEIRIRPWSVYYTPQLMIWRPGVKNEIEAEQSQKSKEAKEKAKDIL